MPRRPDKAPGVARLLSVQVINLASRPDRLAEFQVDMARLGIEAERFDAVAHELGTVGCALSHAACLERFAGERGGCLMVCEDDATFTVDRASLDYLVDRFVDDDAAEVACLAYGGVDLGLAPHNAVFMRGFRVRTSACYLVKTWIAAELCTLWREGAAALADGGDRMRYAVDMIWHPLQERRVFVVPIVRVARQREGHSDIEGRHIEKAW